MIEAFYRQWLIPAFESGLKGRQTLAYWRQLEASQWWTAEQLRQHQLSRLQAMLTYCYQQIPYYRRWWDHLQLHPSQVRSLEDFQRWPVMERQTLREQAAALTGNLQEPGLIRKATGGSSGMPLQFVLDRAANDRRVASTLRGYAWAGATPGTRQTHLWGVPLGNLSWSRRLKERLYQRVLYRRDFINSFAVYEDEIPQIANRINRFRPQVIVAYSNPLYGLARGIQARGLRIHPPRAIVVGAEKLHDFQRELIEQTFSAPVFETYGSREFSLIGSECELHSGLHVTVEHLLVEVVDEQGWPVADGEEGQLVITDLFNRAFPFIRYAIGDRGRAGLTQCSCGRGLPLLPSISGRQLDMLTTVTGKRIAGELFPHLLKDFAAVQQFQVVQQRADNIDLKLVVDQRWTAGDQTRLADLIEQHLDSATQLTIHRVQQIPLTPAGKLRVVISHPAQPTPASAIV